ncbi:MAG: S9 family peptidase [Balneolales bacterium]|nr:S9 family peptidase [Balneolales bacterium]
MKMKLYFSANITLLSVLGLMLVFSSLNAQSPITAEKMWEMDRVGSVTTSPDGRHIAFTKTVWSLETDRSETNIFLMNADGSNMRQFTHHGSDGSPVFSPNSRNLAFTSRRAGGPAQLYVMPLDGGEARQVTDLPVAVSAPKWFPDGNRLAFAATVHPGYDGDWKKHEELVKEMRNTHVTAKVTENRMYRHWDRWLTDGLYPRIFSTTLEGNVIDLMPGSRRFFAMMGAPSYDISPDGSEIAISANTEQPPYEYLNYDILLIPTTGRGTVRNITADNPANDLNPVYSPDGRYIMYGMQTRTDFYADNVRLVRYDRQNSSRQVLTEDIDMSFSNWSWSQDSAKLYFHAQDSGKTSLFSISSAGDNLQRILHAGTNGAPQLLGNDRLVFTHNTLSAPDDIYSIGINGEGLTQLTDVNRRKVANLSLGKVENVTYTGANGADVQMFIVYPPNFDPSKKYPLVMLIHGGPHGIFGDQFHYRWNAHLFAAPGYVVALPNFHGSTSFGQEFAESIHGAHADLPFRDVMKATDFMIGRGYIDETKMAAAGGSYGGYLVSWIAGHTDRFAALINHAGVYNIMGQFASDVTAHRVAAYSGAPWDGLESMQRWNPAMHAENFKTPMLVIHGELDYRVPVLQGLEVYGVYKGKGLDARLVYFPDENHWILRPNNSVFWYKEVHNWLHRYFR